MLCAKPLSDPPGPAGYIQMKGFCIGNSAKASTFFFSSLSLTVHYRHFALRPCHLVCRLQMSGCELDLGPGPPSEKVSQATGSSGEERQQSGQSEHHRPRLIPLVDGDGRETQLGQSGATRSSWVFACDLQENIFLFLAELHLEEYQARFRDLPTSMRKSP